jgi:hypothetical protein
MVNRWPRIIEAHRIRTQRMDKKIDGARRLKKGQPVQSNLNLYTWGKKKKCKPDIDFNIQDNK